MWRVANGEVSVAFNDQTKIDGRQKSGLPFGIFNFFGSGNPDENPHFHEKNSSWKIFSLPFVLLRHAASQEIAQ